MAIQQRKARSRLLVALLALLVLSACGKKEEARDYKFDEAFAPYISAFTSQTISRKSTIQVQLTKDVASPEMVGVKLTGSPIEFSPAIDGKARWVGPRTLEFEPEKPLPSGTFYEASLPLKAFFDDVAEAQEVFKFTFETMKQAFSVIPTGTETIDKNKLKWQAVTGALNTADFEYGEEVEKLLQAEQDGKALKIKWTHALNGISHTFLIDSVARKVDPGAVKLSWDGDPLGIEQEGEEEIAIPALGDFKAVSTETFDDPEQYVAITFSDPLRKSQNLDGLIRLADHELRFVISGNVVKAYPRERVLGMVTLTVDPGVRNILGHKLQEQKVFDIQFEEPKPEVRLVGNGVILPRQGGSLPFAFESVNLSAIQLRVMRIYEDNILQFLQNNTLSGSSELYRVGKQIHESEINIQKNPKENMRTWRRNVVDLSTLIDPEPGAIYRVTIDFEEEHSLYSCEGGDEGESADEEEDEDDYYYERGGYYERYNNRDNPCHEAYFNFQDRSVSRNVLASDLGLIAKSGSDGSLTVAVNDLHSTAPLSGIELEIYDFQQQLIKRLSSDGDGLATAKLDETPFVLVAKKGSQRGYLKLQDGQALSLSKFDISGKHYHKGVKGYIYGERGVWRPGDTIYTTFILEDKLEALPDEHPVTFTLTNPRGQQVAKKIKKNGTNGVFTFQTATAEDAPTGNYQLAVQVGGATFEKTLKVETVMPNRLKISLDFEDEYLGVGEESPKVTLGARWLHGATAKNLQADVSVNLKQSKTSFKSFAGYTFDDPIREFDSERQVIFEGALDEKGQAELPLEISAGDEAPGVLKASFVTKVFEPGGNFSTDRFSIPYYPYENFVGVKLPKGKGYRGWLKYNKEHTVQIVNVDQQGKAQQNGEVEVTLYKMEWRWWWDRHNSRSNYNEQFYKSEIKTQKVKLRNGKGYFKFKLNDWGRYMVRATNSSGHATGQMFYLDYPWWNSKETEMPGGATMLTFNADKQKYKVGEIVKLNIPMAAGSRALVSLESGSKVISTHWLKASDGKSTQFSFPATKEMAPNIYAHVTLLQPHAQTANDLPMRLYGVTPLEITDPNTVLKPVVTTAKTFRPMEKAKVTVRESNGKPMTYTVAVVDEGLLDLTRFKTPDPWGNFYAREALEVKTWDLYDQVAGAYGADLSKLLGIGGDGGIAPKEGSKVNRFKPVVKFFGPFELGAGKSATHSFQMPNYVGSVKTMVVARNGSAYGSGHKATPVRKPLMALGTLPRVVGPGESVRFPVTIFAMEKHVKDVTVKLSAGDLFTVEGGVTRKLNFTEPGDQMAFFDLNVKERIGKTTVKVTAQSGSEVAVYHIDIEVRNPNPPVKEVVEATLENGMAWKQDFTFPGMAGTNSGVLEVSSIPPINLGYRLNYLIQYPHGCVEQTTSSVLPQLYVNELMEVPKQRREEVERNIRAGIKRLESFQTEEGGLGYWPGDPHNNEWGTNYGGKFILEAKLKGYRVPDKFFNNWLKYQKRTSRKWESRYNGDEIIQAERLYLLALAGSPELGAMNRLREHKDLGLTSKWRLAAAYHLAGQPEAAKKLSRNLGSTVNNYTQLAFTYGSNTRDHGLILECIAVMEERSKGADLAKVISRDLSSTRWLNTQATGFALIGMARYVGVNKTNEPMKYRYRINGGAWQQVSSSKPISQIDLPAGEVLKGSVDVQKQSGSMLFVRLITEGTPVTGDQKRTQSNLKMNVSYTDLEGDPIDVTELVQGTDFIAEVTLSNPGKKGDLEEMALSQIFPSGWEIHNSRMDGIDLGDPSSKPEYQDIRDDRVYTYFDLGDGYNRSWWYYYGYKEESTTKTFRILLNASYLGRFYLPTVYCEAMYDATISARIPGKWVTVVKPGDS